MRGIGDYIHYHQNRYLRSGIDKYGDINDYEDTFHKAKQNLFQHINSTADLDKCDEISKFYTNLFYGENGLFNENTTTAIQLKDENGNDVGDPLENIYVLISEIMENYWKGDPNTDKKPDERLKYVNPESVKRSIQNQTAKRGFKGIQKNRKLRLGNTGIRKKTLIAILDKLDEALKISKDAFDHIRNIDEHFKTVKDFQKTITDLNNDLNNIINGFDEKTKFYKWESNPSLRTTLDKIEDILQLYRGDYAGYIAGLSWEVGAILGAAFQNTANGVIITNLADIIQNQLVGSNMVDTEREISIDSTIIEQLQKLEGENKLNDSYSLPDGTGTIKYSSSKQGTIDVVLKVPGEDNDLYKIIGADKLNASLKNYSHAASSDKGSGDNLHIFDGNYFNNLMEFNTNFINHYLNLLGSHPIRQDTNALANELAQANALIISQLVIRGIEGSQKDNQCLMIMDRRTPSVKVYSVKTILSKLNDYQDEINKYVYVDQNFPTWTKGRSINTWVPASRTEQKDIDAAVAKRIAKYIAALSHIDIKVSLTPAYFKGKK